MTRARRPLRLVCTERPFSRGSGGLSGRSGLLMPLERNIEKVPVTCGVLEVFDPRSFLPRCSVASDLVEEAQLRLVEHKVAQVEVERELAIVMLSTEPVRAAVDAPATVLTALSLESLGLA